MQTAVEKSATIDPQLLFLALRVTSFAHQRSAPARKPGASSTPTVCECSWCETGLSVYCSGPLTRSSTT